MRGSKKDRFQCSGVRFQDGLDSGIQVSVNRCRIPDPRYWMPVWIFDSSVFLTLTLLRDYMETRKFEMSVKRKDAIYLFTLHQNK